MVRQDVEPAGNTVLRGAFHPGPMALLSRTTLLAVPPLVVAAAVGGILARAVSPQTARGAREDSLRARWAVPSEHARLLKDVDAYVAEYGADPEARWLAAEAYTRMLLPERAFNSVFQGSGAVVDTRTARRFAAPVLPLLGRLPGPPPVPSALYARTVLARIDAGDADARTELLENI